MFEVVVHGAANFFFDPTQWARAWQQNLATFIRLCQVLLMLASAKTFARRGIVEGFFGPPWSMAQRLKIDRMRVSCYC
jgi:hypothetical protein